MQETQQIALRPFRIEDAETVANLCNNKKIFDNLRDFFPHPYSRQDAVDFIRHCQVHDPVLNFGVTVNDRLVGGIGLVLQTDVYSGTGEIGYWLGEPFWGKGIMPEAVRQMVRYGFRTLRLRRIFTGVYDYNPASMRVLEKAGFVHEGISRGSVKKNGIVCNEHLYGILAEEV